MFQAGYLTIKGYFEDEKCFVLGFPIKEVREAVALYGIKALSHATDDVALSAAHQCRKMLEANDLEGFFITFKRLISSIPYQLH